MYDEDDGTTTNSIVIWDILCYYQDVGTAIFTPRRKGRAILEWACTLPAVAGRRFGSESRNTTNHVNHGWTPMDTEGGVEALRECRIA